MKTQVQTGALFANPVFSDLDESTIGHKMKNI